jgi:hypothetical protein
MAFIKVEDVHADDRLAHDAAPRPGVAVPISAGCLLKGL